MHGFKHRYKRRKTCISAFLMYKILTEMLELLDIDGKEIDLIADSYWSQQACVLMRLSENGSWQNVVSAKDVTCHQIFLLFMLIGLLHLMTQACHVYGLQTYIVQRCFCTKRNAPFPNIYTRLALVCLYFVSSVTQKLLNRLSQSLVSRWYMEQGRNEQILMGTGIWITLNQWLFYTPLVWGGTACSGGDIGGLGAVPPAGPGAKPLVRGSGGEAPPRS